jgi:hypothetical protein
MVLSLKNADINKSTGVNRFVIVKFTNSRWRKRVYNNCKSIGSGIFVHENLTRFREALAHKTRKLVHSKYLAKRIAGWENYCLPLQVESTPNAYIHIKDMFVIHTFEDETSLTIPYKNHFDQLL